MINVLALKPGDRLQLTGRVIAEVTENMEDGMWVQVRYLEVPDHPDQRDALELCHAQDIVKVLDASAGSNPTS